MFAQNFGAESKTTRAEFGKKEEEEEEEEEVGGRESAAAAHYRQNPGKSSTFPVRLHCLTATPNAQCMQAGMKTFKPTPKILISGGMSVNFRQ